MHYAERTRRLSEHAVASSRWSLPGLPVVEHPNAIRRRRSVVAVTLVLGTAILAGTLAHACRLGVLLRARAPRGRHVDRRQAILAGPIPLRRQRATSARIEAIASVLLGGALFGAFLGAKLLAAHLPIVSGSVTSVLATADAGPRVSVLAVALLNGVGEELFFRGSLRAAFAKHAGFWATALYCLVTVATLNVALVVAALVMGTVFNAERRATGGVLAPMITHLSWSTLMILLLPR